MSDYYEDLSYGLKSEDAILKEFFNILKRIGTSAKTISKNTRDNEVRDIDCVLDPFGKVSIKQRTREYGDVALELSHYRTNGKKMRNGWSITTEAQLVLYASPEKIYVLRNTKNQINDLAKTKYKSLPQIKLPPPFNQGTYFWGKTPDRGYVSLNVPVSINELKEKEILMGKPISRGGVNAQPKN